LYFILFFQRNDDEVIEFPSLLYASRWFASSKTYFRWTDPQTEAFAFNQLLHHKTKLLEDETELLVSAKQIVANFITVLKKIFEEDFSIPIEEELQAR
jgi:hypothetical protein